MENKMKEKLMLVSLDGVPAREFQKVWKEESSCLVQELWTVYPSITGPAHVSVLTGLTPVEHGIMENMIIKKDNGEILSLYDPGKEEATMVMPEDNVVHWLVKERFRCISVNWPLGRGLPGENYTEDMIRHEEISGVDIAWAKDRKALEILKSQMKSNDWDFIDAHFEEYDSAAHMYGVNAERTKEALSRMTKYVKELIDMAEIYGISNILFFSDHGMFDKKESFFPAIYLKEHGYQKEIIEERISFLADGSGCAQLFSTLTNEDTEHVIECLKESGKIADIKMIGNQEDIRREKDIFLRPVALLEMCPGVCAEDIIDASDERYQEMKGLHGYNPEHVREMNGFFMAYDPDKRLSTESDSGRRKLTDIPYLIKLLMKEGKCNES